MKNWKKALQEQGRTEKKLTDEGIKEMIPMFVETNKHRSIDHKCGNCKMRIMSSGDKGLCTVMEGEISMKNGTCSFWAEGLQPSSKIDIHETQMKKSTAGYIEVDGEINCGTCLHFDEEYCTLWAGRVKPTDCCMTWEV